MFSAFLVQYAAGCFFAVAATAIKLTDWRYVRLMCIVSTAIALLALVFRINETNDPRAAMTEPAVITLGVGLLGGFAWLFLNSVQGDQIRNSQRAISAAAGTACLAASLWIALGNKPPNTVTEQSKDGSVHTTTIFMRPVPNVYTEIGSIILGAGLLGVATTAMLLGHRYLTDTGMAITPLKKLTNLYLGLLAARFAWCALILTPVFLSDVLPSAAAIYFWLALGVRVGVGLLVAGVFGYMIWDCVRRRATQSATALYYLSMLFIFFGELSAQYLLHEEGLAL